MDEYATDYTPDDLDGHNDPCDDIVSADEDMTPYAPPIPVSRRCTSRCPARGYIGCDRERHHGGACTGSGFRWRRGRGQMKPYLYARPPWDA